MKWHQAIEKMNNLVVRISTPQGSGTGFLVSHSTVKPVCGIATAAHVVDWAHYWEQPIRIDHFASGKSLLLHHNERSIHIEGHDTATIILEKRDLPLPEHSPKLSPEEKFLKVGNEVGWLGFPAISPKNLCFFSGRTSCFLEEEHAYLVDGVAINGVSGGPVFHLLEDGFVVIGVVSAYIANRVTGETLPGLSVIRDVSQFHKLVREFKSLDDAKKKESVPSSPPSPSPSPSPNIGSDSK
ncbi:MAG: trypsin-like peptidase domain-containing protein [Candidatus Omnitrophica bacterium]|nr:trypsin-like peptidase domain-containing protein [Candidatus Omnitrophota bacterium]